MSLDLSLLSSDQLKPVTSNSRFICVTAGAGSGKTRVLTYRFAYLFDQRHVPKSRILCVTFTKKATQEMRDRIKGLISTSVDTVMTLNSLGYHILVDEIYRIGWENCWETLVSTRDSLKKLKQIIDMDDHLLAGTSLEDFFSIVSKRKVATDYLKYLVPDEETDIDQIISHAKETAISLSNASCLTKEQRKQLKEAKEALLFYRYLQLQTQEDRFIDFTDQICIPLMMFDKFPDMLEKWSSRYDHILVDEFQDVSLQDYKLCEKLTGEHTSLFVVGDPDQMIYGWRDADCMYLREFANTHRGTACFELSTNYRSTKQIVEAANHLIRCNTDTHNSKRYMTAYNEADGPKVKYAAYYKAV
ncbi:MAG: ATP-dependent helicase [Clostridia bacterium]|nr:ATP-dependent helicase [Clostridia bacterium]